MDDGKDHTLVTTATAIANGGDTAGDALFDGAPAKKNQETLTPEEDDGDDGSLPKAGKEDIHQLRREIEGLLTDRSKLERQLDDALRSLDRAEAENRSLADQAFNLEGQLRRTQEDLTAASSTADDAEAEAKRLKATLRDLQAAKARAEADLEANLDELRAKVRRLEEELLLAEERTTAAVAEALRKAAAREAELEAAMMALQEKTAQLEAQIAAEYQSKIDRDLPPEINGKKEADAAPATGFEISWGSMAAGCVFGFAVTTAFCIYRASQR